MSYLADADDSKVKAIYTLLKKEIQEEGLTLTDEQLSILDQEHDMHVSGKTKSYNRKEASQIIRGQKAF